MRSELPKNYLVKLGEQFENFDNAEDWSVPTHGMLNENTTEVKRGTKSLKLSVTVAGDFVQTEKEINFSGFKNKDVCHRLWLYVHDDPQKIEYILIYLTSTYFTSFFTSNARGLYAPDLIKGWNLVTIPHDGWTKTGVENWDNTFLKVRLKVQAADGEMCSVTFDAWDYDVKSVPKVILTFDDAYDNLTISNGYNYMISNGLKGTIYVNPANVGSTGVLTTDQLDYLYNEHGWALGNHTFDHVTLTDLDLAGQELQIKSAQDWLLARGYKRSAKHFAVPYGAHDANTLQALKNCGVITGRTSLDHQLVVPPHDFHQLPILSIEQSTSVDTIKTSIDKVIHKGHTLILLYHKIRDVSSDAYENTMADFKAVIDYLVERKVDVVTIDEWYEGLTNPRYRSLPLNRTVV